MTKSKKHLFILTVLILAGITYFFNRDNSHITDKQITELHDKKSNLALKTQTISHSPLADASDDTISQALPANQKISQQQNEALAHKTDIAHPKDHRAKHHHARPHGHEKRLNTPQNKPPGEPKVIIEER